MPDHRRLGARPATWGRRSAYVDPVVLVFDLGSDPHHPVPWDVGILRRERFRQVTNSFSNNHQRMKDHVTKIKVRREVCGGPAGGTLENDPDVLINISKARAG